MDDWMYRSWRSACLGAQALPGKNFISGCCAVGSAPALGAGGPGFESPHSDHFRRKIVDFSGFPSVFVLTFVIWLTHCDYSVCGQKNYRRRTLPACGIGFTLYLTHYPIGSYTRWWANKRCSTQERMEHRYFYLFSFSCAAATSLSKSL